uniref:WW domain-containing protein n=1 Tax=Chromera velia CCMP2878 TaxID=1169474 RepID=A0A0G4FGY7_9ALVE|eukprot:Cvel_16972.t1-p1 / transcript=Cvel_16972.t1 / gene=Cvel_16972 / organism=Chromera_velia_CCMP2878 / gene_product=hypothetical protein / transcript_product=hypothetical protein / location=Cvel_scaffold1332:25310-35334(-) / protein_length=1688 / sequence_SO=supercontig / SO=protein_coding / is_pseudo=false
MSEATSSVAPRPSTGDPGGRQISSGGKMSSDPSRQVTPPSPAPPSPEDATGIAIRMVGKLLDISPNVDADIFWIAEEVVAEGMRPDWLELSDESTGLPYFHNVVTRETTWRHPCAGFLDPVIEFFRSLRGNRSSAAVLEILRSYTRRIAHQAHLEGRSWEGPFDAAKWRQSAGSGDKTGSSNNTTRGTPLKSATTGLFEDGGTPAPPVGGRGVRGEGKRVGLRFAEDEKEKEKETTPLKNLREKGWSLERDKDRRPDSNETPSGASLAGIQEPYWYNRVTGKSVWSNPFLEINYRFGLIMKILTRYTKDFQTDDNRGLAAELARANEAALAIQGHFRSYRWRSSANRLKEAELPNVNKLYDATPATLNSLHWERNLAATQIQAGWKAYCVSGFLERRRAWCRNTCAVSEHTAASNRPSSDPFPSDGILPGSAGLTSNAETTGLGDKPSSQGTGGTVAQAFARNQYQSRKGSADWGTTVGDASAVARRSSKVDVVGGVGSCDFFWKDIPAETARAEALRAQRIAHTHALQSQKKETEEEEGKAVTAPNPMLTVSEDPYLSEKYRRMLERAVIRVAAKKVTKEERACLRPLIGLPEGISESSSISSLASSPFLSNPPESSNGERGMRALKSANFPLRQQYSRAVSLKPRASTSNILDGDSSARRFPVSMSLFHGAPPAWFLAERSLSDSVAGQDDNDSGFPGPSGGSIAQPPPPPDTVHKRRLWRTASMELAAIESAMADQRRALVKSRRDHYEQELEGFQPPPLERVWSRARGRQMAAKKLGAASPDSANEASLPASPRLPPPEAVEAEAEAEGEGEREDDDVAEEEALQEGSEEGEQSGSRCGRHMSPDRRPYTLIGPVSRGKGRGTGEALADVRALEDLKRQKRRANFGARLDACISAGGSPSSSRAASRPSSKKKRASQKKENEGEEEDGEEEEETFPSPGRFSLDDLQESFEENGDLWREEDEKDKENGLSRRKLFSSQSEATAGRVEGDAISLSSESSGDTEVMPEFKCKEELAPRLPPLSVECADVGMVASPPPHGGLGGGSVRASPLDRSHSKKSLPSSSPATPQGENSKSSDRWQAHLPLPQGDSSQRVRQQERGLEKGKSKESLLERGKSRDKLLLGEDGGTGSSREGKDKRLEKGKSKDSLKLGGEAQEDQMEEPTEVEKPKTPTTTHNPDRIRAQEILCTFRGERERQRQTEREERLRTPGGTMTRGPAFLSSDSGAPSAPGAHTATVSHATASASGSEHKSQKSQQSGSAASASASARGEGKPLLMLPDSSSMQQTGGGGRTSILTGRQSILTGGGRQSVVSGGARQSIMSAQYSATSSGAAKGKDPGGLDLVTWPSAAWNQFNRLHFNYTPRGPRMGSEEKLETRLRATLMATGSTSSKPTKGGEGAEKSPSGAKGRPPDDFAAALSMQKQKKDKRAATPIQAEIPLELDARTGLCVFPRLRSEHLREIAESSMPTRIGGSPSNQRNISLPPVNTRPVSASLSKAAFTGWKSVVPQAGSGYDSEDSAGGYSPRFPQRGSGGEGGDVFRSVSMPADLARLVGGAALMRMLVEERKYMEEIIVEGQTVTDVQREARGELVKKIFRPKWAVARQGDDEDGASPQSPAAAGATAGAAGRSRGSINYSEDAFKNVLPPRFLRMHASSTAGAGRKKGARDQTGDKEDMLGSSRKGSVAVPGD